MKFSVSCVLTINRIFSDPWHILQLYIFINFSDFLVHSVYDPDIIWNQLVLYQSFSIKSSSNLDWRSLARLDINRARRFPVRFNAFKTEIYNLFSNSAQKWSLSFAITYSKFSQLSLLSDPTFDYASLLSPSPVGDHVNISSTEW